MADDDVMTVSGQDQQPDAPNVPPAVFGALTQAPDVGQANPAPPTLAPQPIQRPMSGGPLLGQMLAELVKSPTQMQAAGPGQIATDRPVSRALDFEGFLNQFLYSLGQGFAQEGRGPGAALRGAGAAITAPIGLAQTQQEMQQRQAQIAQQQAQTGMLQAGQQPVSVDFGNGPQQIPASYVPNIYKGFGAAQVNQQTALQKQQLVNRGQMSIQEMKQEYQQGLIGKIEDYRDPQSGEYLGMMAYDRQGNPIKLLSGAFDPRTLQNVNNRQQVIQTGPGQWTVVNLTSTSGKAVPGAAPGGAPQQQTAVPGVTGITQPPTARQQLGAAVPGLGAAMKAANAPRPSGGGRQILGTAPLFAFDPQTNERVLTNPQEVAQKGYTNPVPVKEGEIDKYTTAQKQFNDVQANLSRYVAAANRFAQQGQGSDAVGINLAINQASLGGGIHLGPAGVEIPGISSLGEAADRVARSASYKGLSPAGKDLVDGYLRTIASVPAYEKALTGVGKFNKEIMDLELRNIPDPTMAPQDILRKLQAFQENVDQGASGIPRMPGIPTIKDIQRRFGPQQQGFSQAPTNLPQQMGFSQ